MCSKGGGSPPVPNSASTSFQSTTTPAPFATPLYQDFLNRANTLSQTPFNPAMQGQVAPFAPEQRFAGEQLYHQGLEMGNFDPAKVREIESPYTQDVVNATQNWFNNQNAIQGNDLLSQAIKSGNAFGGDRAGVAESVLAGQQQLAQAPVIAGLYQSGYTQALNEYNLLKNMGMQGAQAALGWGGMEQAQQQREFDVAQQNAMMASAYPFQTLNWYGAALGGVAPLLGAQTMGFNTPPEQSNLAGGIGAASAAIGLGNAAFGSPAGGGGVGIGQKRGGVVRRVRGGLVPVLIRHNGGIIQGLAYGGPIGDSDDDDDQHEPAGLPEQARDERAQSEDYRPPQTGLPPREKPAAWGSQIGQLKTGSKQTTPSSFPGGSSGSTASQPSAASTVGGWLDVGTKAVSLGSKLLPALALLERGGMVHHLQDGGGDDGVLSDAEPDPVLPDQQYARDYSGRTTWFNPRNERGGYTYRDDSGQDWTDTGARRLREGPHASGLPSTTPGFATPGSADLGNWFEVKGPGGARSYAQKTDIGPAGIVDLNAPLAARMYGRPNAIPGGTTSVRDLGGTRPPEAEDDTEHEPAGKPQQAEDAYPDTGRAGPGARPDTGTGQVGRQIPGLAKPAPTFAQRLANDPFWQFGTALMAKPGLKRYPLQGVGAAAQSMSGQQQVQRRQDLLDAKPAMHDDGTQLHALTADGTLIPTGLPSPSGIKQRQAQDLEAQRQEGRLELQGGKPVKLETLKDPYLGNVKVQRERDGTFWNPATGDRYDKDGNFVQGGDQQQPPAPQQPPAQPQPGQRAPVPPRQTELTPRQDEQWPDQTPVAAQPPAVAEPPVEQKPPAATQQAGGAGAAEALAGPLPPQDEDQKVRAALAASSGGFKSPNKVDQRILRNLGGISKDEFDGLALRYAHGDASMMTGLGGGAQGAAARGALKTRALQYFTDRGMTPEDANRAQLEFMSQKAGARTLGNIEARTTEALTKAAATAPLVIETSRKVPRTNYPDLNRIVNQYYERTGDPNVINFGASIETFANNYAVALGGGSTVVTESAKRHARELLQRAWSEDQIESQVKFLQRELDRELAGVQEGRRRFLGSGQGGQQQGQPQQLAPEDKAAVDWARKNPQHPRSKEILQQNGLQ